jgi:LysR family glycine cleavage system transcriptional activator
MDRRLARLPPLNALRAFVAAARHLSFTRAADELAVTPAAVSQQVKLLEAQLGARLFERRSRALVLTAEGTALLPGLADGFDSIVDALARLGARTDEGPLTVSVAPSFAAKWLVPRLDRFGAAHPGIDVRIQASHDIVDFAADGVDVAIRYGPGGYEGLSVERILPEEMFPVSAPALLKGKHALSSPAALRHHTLLHDDSPDQDPSCPDWRMWLKAAGIDGIDSRRGLRFNQSALVLEAAISGRGVALAKAALAAADLRTKRLVRLFGMRQRLGFAYWFVVPPAKAAWPKVLAFRDWLRDEAQRD